MLTNADIALLKKLFLTKHEFKAELRQEIEKIRQEMATKADLEDLRKEFSHLPSKDEFFQEMEKLYKRQDDSETEHSILNAKVAQHSRQIARLEKHTKLPALI